jgi:hypothetical protein
MQSLSSVQLFWAANGRSWVTQREKHKQIKSRPMKKFVIEDIVDRLKN